MLRKLLIFLTIFTLFAPAAPAKALKAFSNDYKIEEAFKAIPLNVLNILPASTRTQMVEYALADSIWEAPNIYSGLSSIRQLNANQMDIRLTAVSDLKLRFLPVKEGKILMTVYTVGTDEESGEKEMSYEGADSDIRFFDSDFKELPRDKFFKIPLLKDFFEIPRGSATTIKEVREMVPFYTTVYLPSSTEETLKAVITIGKYTSLDDMNILRLFMHPELSYIWNPQKGKFELGIRN